MNVSVVTDSAASLPAGAAERLGIVVVPMTLVLGGIVYADGDLAPSEVVARVGRESVSTSAPSPGDFLKGLAAATEGEESGGQVVALTVSSSMSASYEVAHTAASYVDDAEVRVIDTRTAAGAQGLVVMAAAELARTGASLDAVTAKARQVAGQVRLMAALSSLDYLARSGRVPGAAAWAGRSLGVRAMFEFAAGGVRPRRPARSDRGALDRMVGAMLQARPADPGPGGAVLHAAVLEAQAPESAATLRAMVVEAVPAAVIFEAPFSSVMIAHTGPGLVGLAWWWEARDGGTAT
ncbi:MAG TPA: DegV family protein [Acidimicrobiales bacterium]|jgi:DegV family protein with EDD domain|nr:DegV family protein [Acidimicrobiales bacterium]